MVCQNGVWGLGPAQCGYRIKARNVQIDQEKGSMEPETVASDEGVRSKKKFGNFLTAKLIDSFNFGVFAAKFRDDL